MKLERLVGGESTENTQNTIDVSNLSLDEIRALDNLLSKANISLPGVSRGAKNMS